MRIEKVVLALKQRREAMQLGVFERKLMNEELARQQGRWEGLGEALSIISDNMRNDDD
jgi:hypothetical protein